MGIVNRFQWNQLIFLFRYYGGWVCPNIYYLGHSGVINFGGLRIAGLSGIYKSYDYKKGIQKKDIHLLVGYYETLPYDEQMIRSAYHVRELEIFKLSQVWSIL